MVKYYEQTKSNYSKDTDHLVTINRNGVWIKEKQNSDLVIINADKLENNFLLDISINIISEENLIQKRIEAKKANVVDNLWILENPKIFKFNANSTLPK